MNSGAAHILGADSEMSMSGLRGLITPGPFSTFHPLGTSTLKLNKVGDQ